MPKFVGRRAPEGARQIANNVDQIPGYVRLTYSQMRLVPAEYVHYSLDTTDRGGRGSLAKRWYRWFALAATVQECPRSTPIMMARAEAELARLRRANQPAVPEVLCST